MFHVKQVVNKIKSYQIDEIMFLIFVFCIPFQLRFILNADQAYIGYYFSYHKAIWFYLTDIFFICFATSFFLFSKDRKSGFWPILLPIFWAGVSLFHVEHLPVGGFGLLKIIQIWFIASYVSTKPNILKPILYTLSFSGIIKALIGILQFHVQHGLGLNLLGEYVPEVLVSGTATISLAGEKVLRAYGTMPHPNVLGGFLAVCLFLWLYVSRETKSILNWLIVSCGTFVLTWGLLVSFSRSAWVAAVISCATLITYQTLKKAYKQAIIIVFIVVVSCGTLGLFYKQYVFPRSADISSSSQAILYRNDFNGTGLKILQGNELFGIGPNQYIPTMQQTVSLDPWQYQPPHNIFLLYLIEFGLIGIFIALYAYYKLGFTWNNLDNLSYGLISIVVTVGMLDHYLITLQQGLLLFGVVLGLIIINKRHVSQSVKHV